jgi:hypothetical protein
MNKINLLFETIESIEAYELTVADVSHVEFGDTRVAWDTFACAAKLVDYDCGFGTAKISASLRVVFLGGAILQRQEYDGAEGWQFVPPPFSDRMNTILDRLETLELIYAGRVPQVLREQLEVCPDCELRECACGWSGDTHSWHD